MYTLEWGVPGWLCHAIWHIVISVDCSGIIFIEIHPVVIYCQPSALPQYSVSICYNQHSIFDNAMIAYLII